MCNVVGILYFYLSFYLMASDATRPPAHHLKLTSESGNVRGRCSDAGSEDQAVDPAVVVNVEANKTISSAFMSLARGPLILPPWQFRSPCHDA